FPLWKVKAAKMILKKAIDKSDLVITVSNTSRDDIVSYFPEAESKIEVLYNRLSDEWSNAPPNIDLKTLGIEKDYLLYVGNFKKHKDLPTLLNAHSKLKKAPQLVLVGNTVGDDMALYERIFANSRVRLLGFAEGHLLR